MEIEGEYLDRDSLQSSIRRQFGLITDNRKISAAEQGIAKVMVDLYRTFDVPLSHTLLFEWHGMLPNGRRDLNDIGRYRTHTDRRRFRKRCWTFQYRMLPVRTTRLQIWPIWKPIHSSLAPPTAPVSRSTSWCRK